MAGYHLYEIPKGQMGQYSKVTEEFMEFQDALTQECSIMAILELADLVGSAKYYFFEYDMDALWTHLIGSLLQRKTTLPVNAIDLEESFQHTINETNPAHWEKVCAFIDDIDAYVRQFNLSLKDLLAMSHITERAFINGYRS
jgi:hypothetical protein